MKYLCKYILDTYQPATDVLASQAFPPATYKSPLAAVPNVLHDPPLAVPPVPQRTMSELDTGPPSLPSPMNPARSPPAPRPASPSNASPTNSQLASLLSESCREIDSLRRELSATRKRAEKAERLLATFTQAASGAPINGTGSPQMVVPEAAARVIQDCEARVERAELARDEAEARKRVLMDTWAQLDKYLGVVELRAADARQGFARIVAEGGGQLVLATIPVAGQPGSFPPSHSMSQANFNMPPPLNHSRHAAPVGSAPSRHPSMRSHGAAFPSSLALPPPPNPNAQSRVRPRSDSIDGSGYVGNLSGQPPAKKSRSERREERAMYTESVRTFAPAIDRPLTFFLSRPPPSHPVCASCHLVFFAR